MIIGTIAPPVQRFCRRFLTGAEGFGVWASIVLPILLHGLLLAVKRRTLQALGEATLIHWVCAGTVCRWLARVRFPVDQWYEHYFRQMLQVAARVDPAGDWVVIFDGTALKIPPARARTLTASLLSDLFRAVYEAATACRSLGGLPA